MTKFMRNTLPIDHDVVITVRFLLMSECLFAGCAILDVPSFRNRIPVIVDEVTTLTGPGELIDVVVAELGITINPKRSDLLDAVKGKDLPIRPIEAIKAEVEGICGGKLVKPKLGDRPRAVVKWVDGTMLDTVWQVLEDNPYATKPTVGE